MTTSEASQHFGSVIKMAKVLNISRAAVYQWGEYPPKLRQFELERITNGELKMEDFNV